MPLDLKQKNHVTILIEATVDAFTSEPFELLSERDYTVISTSLGVGEEVDIQIYDYTTDTFQSLKVGGDDVFLTKDYELVTFSRVSCILKFVKTITINPVGISVVSR